MWGLSSGEEVERPEHGTEAGVVSIIENIHRKTAYWIVFIGLFSLMAVVNAVDKKYDCVYDRFTLSETISDPKGHRWCWKEYVFVLFSSVFWDVDWSRNRELLFQKWSNTGNRISTHPVRLIL